jgi:hypothetical protein
MDSEHQQKLAEQGNAITLLATEAAARQGQAGVLPASHLLS